MNDGKGGQQHLTSFKEFADLSQNLVFVILNSTIQKGVLHDSLYF